MDAASLKINLEFCLNAKHRASCYLSEASRHEAADALLLLTNEWIVYTRSTTSALIRPSNLACYLAVAYCHCLDTV